MLRKGDRISAEHTVELCIGADQQNFRIVSFWRCTASAEPARSEPPDPPQHPQLALEHIACVDGFGNYVTIRPEALASAWPGLWGSIRKMIRADLADQHGV